MRRERLCRPCLAYGMPHSTHLAVHSIRGSMRRDLKTMERRCLGNTCPAEGP